MKTYKEGECPEVKHTKHGDICNLRLRDRSCLIEHGLYTCEYFEEYLKEIEEVK